MKGKYTLGILSLAALMGCQDDLGVNTADGDLALNLYMGRSAEGFVQARAVNTPNGFPVGTSFHLFGTAVSGTTESWATNYLSTTTTSDVAVGTGGYDADEAENRHVHEIATSFRAQPLNFYGVVVTDDTATDTDKQTAYNTLLGQYKQPHTAGDVPTYVVTHMDASGAKQVVTLPDVLWSDSLKNMTAIDNAGKMVMPFTHTLSKLRFYAVAADEVKETIQITSLQVHDYADGTLSMKSGLYAERADDVSRSAAVPVFSNSTGVTVKKDLPATAEPFATTLIFPTDGAKYDTPYTGTVAGTIDDNKDAVKITLGITYGNTAKTLTALLKMGSDNFAFLPNYEYKIVFSLTTTTAVVTIIPLHYDYIPEDIPLDSYEVGEPVDFGGMMWAAANLGATAADPTVNALAWERSRGFYYQFGRNIPFYTRGSVLDPYPEVALTTGGTFYKWIQEDCTKLYPGESYDPVNNPYVPNTAYRVGGNVNVNVGTYTDGTKHGARAYPYIPKLWEREITKAGNIDDGYEAFLIDYRARCRNGLDDNGNKYYGGQTLAQANDIPMGIDPYTDPYEANELTANSTNKMKMKAAYISYQWYWPTDRTNRDWDYDADNSTSGTNWETAAGVSVPENQPCPKGWRLPTAAEWLSILPASAAAGDISFTGNGSYGTATGDKTHNAVNFNKAYYTTDVTNDYLGDPGSYVGIYQDGRGNNNLNSKNDPTAGADVAADARQGWGTVYAIKGKGTDNAYLLRWHIEVVGDTKTHTQVNTSGEFPTDRAWRGVLVISRYILGDNKHNVALKVVGTGKASANKSTEATHECVPYYTDTNQNVGIDWDKPSGQLYLPFCGYIITAGIGQGLIYAGTETLYWSSTAYSRGGQGYGQSARIKFAGSYTDRFLYVRPTDYRDYGAQIRCVRDTKAPYQ